MVSTWALIGAVAVVDVLWLAMSVAMRLRRLGGHETPSPMPPIVSMFAYPYVLATGTIAPLSGASRPTPVWWVEVALLGMLFVGVSLGLSTVGADKLAWFMVLRSDPTRQEAIRANGEPQLQALRQALVPLEGRFLTTSAQRSEWSVSLRFLDPQVDLTVEYDLRETRIRVYAGGRRPNESEHEWFQSTDALRRPTMWMGHWALTLPRSKRRQLEALLAVGKSSADQVGESASSLVPAILAFESFSRERLEH